MHDHVASFPFFNCPCAPFTAPQVSTWHLIPLLLSGSGSFSFSFKQIQFVSWSQQDLTRMRKGGCLRSGFVNHICSDVQAVTAPDNHSASVKSLACQTPHKLSSNNNQIRDLPKLIWEGNERKKWRRTGKKSIAFSFLFPMKQNKQNKQGRQKKKKEKDQMKSTLQIDGRKAKAKEKRN